MTVQELIEKLQNMPEYSVIEIYLDNEDVLDLVINKIEYDRGNTIIFLREE